MVWLFYPWTVSQLPTPQPFTTLQPHHRTWSDKTRFCNIYHFVKALNTSNSFFSYCNIYMLFRLQFLVFIKQDSKARSCVAGISNSVPLPENNRFSFETLDDPAVVGRAKAVRPAVVSRTPDLSHFTVQDLKGMPTADWETSRQRCNCQENKNSSSFWSLKVCCV